MKKQVHHEHDKSYRAFFENKEIFLELLHSFIKENWTTQIDPLHLEEDKSHYILRDFEESEADIVYKATINNKEIYFVVLLELQSSVDHSMPIRLLFYMNEIWRKVVKAYPKNTIKSPEFKLPAIVPIVLYNGAANWTVPLEFKDKLDHPQLFNDYVVNFKYHLINVNHYTKENLLELKNTIASIFLLDQNIDRSEFILRAGALSETYKSLSTMHQLKIKDWLINILKEDCIEDVLVALEKGIKEAEKMSIGFLRYEEEQREIARNEGHLEGQRKGRLEGRLEGKIESARALLDLLDDQTIADKLELPIDTIRSLRKESQKGLSH